MQSIIYTSSPGKAVTQILSEKPCDKVFILTDDATNMHCKPLLLADMAEVETFHINIPATDANKTLESLTHVWHTLGNMGATRHSLMICLGGGMVTDLGGFAAATAARAAGETVCSRHLRAAQRGLHCSDRRHPGKDTFVEERTARDRDHSFPPGIRTYSAAVHTAGRVAAAKGRLGSCGR